MVKVRNMVSESSGREVANQFIIEADGAIYFQSYDSVIAKKEGGRITLDERYWQYSATTGKYRNQFLGEKKKETELKIRNGIYQLADLN